MFQFREAAPEDEDAILELANYLNTLNLPPERSFIHELLERSQSSFSGSPDFNPERHFLFVLENPAGQVVGTAMIHAQHGTYDEPHVFFRVLEEEHYADLRAEKQAEHHGVHMVHKMLHLGLTYDGPTELGGLVLHPNFRSHPEKLGRLLSLARFVFIAAFRSWFRDRLLAELLPPLYKSPEGSTRSPLWDVLGHRFTGLSYEEADRLSRFNKEFIWRLFPVMPVHTSLLPEGVQEIIGRVGEPTKGAQKLLERIGFKYEHRIDPFDGGPHLEANTDQVTIIRNTRSYLVEAGSLAASAIPAIVATVSNQAPHFRAVWTPVQILESSPAKLRISSEAFHRLELHNRPLAFDQQKLQVFMARMDYPSK